MSTARQNLRTFPHRHNPDGTFDSICPDCYVTISRQNRESDLITFERTTFAIRSCLAAFLVDQQIGRLKSATNIDRFDRRCSSVYFAYRPFNCCRRPGGRPKTEAMIHLR